MESRSTARIFYWEALDGTPAQLVVEIEIHCPRCGEQRIRIVGHHLKMIRDVCIDAIDQHPELTSTEPQVTDRMRITGRSNDPSTS